MTAPPLPFVWDGIDSFVCRRPNAARQHYGGGEVVVLAPVEERSEVSHRHEFAWLKDAWATLPEELAERFPSSESLRKQALIATGWCNVRDYVCTSRKEAERLAAALRGEVDEYAVVIVRDDVVRVARAKSQARNKMNAKDFAASKQAVLEWVATLLQTSPAALERTEAA